MAINRFIPLYHTQSGAVPAVSSLNMGELAINVTDGRIFTKNEADQIVLIGAAIPATASSAITASYARFADYLNGQVASYYLNATNINDGTLDNARLPSQINVIGYSGSFTGSLVGSASWASAAGVALDVDYARVSNKPTLVSSSIQVNSGSFTGSFIGSASYAITASYGRDATFLHGQDQAYYRDATNINAGTLNNARLPTQIDQTGFTGSFRGNLFGTASMANTFDMQSSSFYRSATNINAGTLDNARLPAQISQTGFTGSFRGNLFGTASMANTFDMQSSSFYRSATNINAGTLDNARLPAQIDVTGHTGSFRGNLFGTASMAFTLDMQSASFYRDATNINAGTLANARLPAQINQTGYSGSFTGSLIGSSSQATTASYGRDATFLHGQDQAFYRDATNINAGTLNNARLPAQISVTGYSGSVSGTLFGTASFANTLAGQSGSFYRDATNINAGTLNNARLPAQIDVTGVTGSFRGNLFGTASMANTFDMQSSSFYRDATNINAGTLANVRLPSQINQTGYSGSFTGSFTGILPNASASYATTASYGRDATYLHGQDQAYYRDASNINAGTLSNSYLPAQISQTGFTGSFRGNMLGTSSMAFTLDMQSASYYRNADNINAGTLANARLPAQISQTGYSGSFTGSFIGNFAESSASYALTASYAANAGGTTNSGSFTGSFTGSVTNALTASYLEGVGDGDVSGTFSGSGAQIFNLNATYISAGTLDNLRLANPISGSATLGKLGLNAARDATAVMVASGQYFSTRVVTTTTLDWNSGNVQSITLATGGNTFTFSNPKDGGRYILIIRQPSSGGAGTITWPAGISWPGNVVPTLTTTNNRYDIVSFVYSTHNSENRYFASFNLDFVNA